MHPSKPQPFWRAVLYMGLCFVLSENVSSKLGAARTELPLNINQTRRISLSQLSLLHSSLPLPEVGKTEA